MTNDITALEEALNQCEAAKNTLAMSATTTTVTPGPPIFTAIEKTGVAEFKERRSQSSHHRCWAPQIEMTAKKIFISKTN